MGDERKVVVTGIGVVSPLGSSRHGFWQRVIAGQGAVGEVEAFSTKGYRVHRGCEVRSFDFHSLTGVRAPAEMGRASQMAVGAAALAIEDARLDLQLIDPLRIGVSVGTTCGEIQVLEHLVEQELQRGSDGLSSGSWLHSYQACSIPSSIAHWFGLAGPNVMIPNACAAGNYAVGYASDLIRLGEADVMLAGGADPFSRVAFTGFARLGSVAPQFCQPFDKNRRGILIGEGAGVIVVEELAHAKARRARIYAEIAGCGMTGDGYHMTAPRADGDGIARAMRLALAEASTTPSEVDYISAHGTGTLVNDRVETAAVKKVFGRHARRLAMSSIKSMIGHTLGAASAIETAVCALAIASQTLPPTINYETPDPNCDLDCVPNVSRPWQVGVVLNNAVAFGGANSSLLLRRVCQ